MPAERSGRVVAVTLAVGLAVVVAVVVLALSDRDVHLAGTNNVFDRFPVADLEPGDELCERFETVPADAATVRLSIEQGVGPLAVRVLDGGREVSSGERAGGWVGPTVDIPIGVVPRTVADGQVCITNRADGVLTLRGYGIEPARLGFTLRGEQVDKQVRLTYLREEPESWWSVAGVVGHRFGIGRGELFGGWVAFAWLAGVLAMVALTVGLVLRTART